MTGAPDGNDGLDADSGDGDADADREDGGLDADPGDGGADEVEVLVRHADGETTLSVPRGTVLRDALLAADRSPYARLTARANCGGRGLCATCGVRLREGPPPEHWHDRLADRFGYPRLSCQVTVDAPMTVELLPDKRVWGGRERE